MQSEDFIPVEPLRPFIKSFKVIESHDEVVNRILPSAGLTLAFRLKGQINYVQGNMKSSLPSATFSGLRKTVRLVNYVDNSSTLLVLFKEGGATAFFKDPLHELFEQSVSLSSFIKQREVAILEEQLAESRTNQQRVAVLEKFLLNKLYSKTDRLVVAATEKIQAANGVIKINELAQSLFISNDAFEKRFRKIVGTSPKQFSSIVRLQSIVRQGNPNKSLAQLALDAGYFDQSHFNKDFKLFTGQSPTEFFNSPRLW